ncbi:MAG: DUF1553 domain-containing protein, partial [Planctomycetota bacterium]|nr:DUF1553 domain-containing protein [Planctomycetota bacterium]
VTASPGAEGFTKGIIWRGVVNASQRPEMQGAQNLGQVFLGTNLKCASCHDSFVNQWKLSDAYALAAVFSEAPLEMHHCDKPTGEIAEVGFLFPELGTIDAASPKPERLQQLAGLMLHPENGRVSRTLVNRLWAQLFGRGIVEPVDNLDAEPWHQDLLDSLASDFVEQNYDINHVLELICTSRAYQLPAAAYATDSDGFIFVGPHIKRMTAEQFADAVSTITGRWQSVTPAMFKPDGRGQGGQLTAVALAKGEDSPQLPGVGEWIWSHKNAAQADEGGRIYLRHDFDLDELPTRMAAVLTADNECVLYINNQQVAASENWSVPLTVELTPFLVKGKNKIAVEAANWPDTSKGKGLDVKGANPAGFRFFAAAWNGELLTSTIESNASWRFSTTELPDWRTGEFDNEQWNSAVPLEGTIPWSLGESFSLIADPGLTSHVRASLVPNDPFLHALGRPGREQVVTHRESLATTLEALELTNGNILYEQLQTGAVRWFALANDADASDKPVWLIEHLYIAALGRSPTADEMRVARELVGEPVAQERIEDLLWMLLMLPEFQLIR